MNRNRERGSMYAPELTTGIPTASLKLVNFRGIRIRTPEINT